jgi:integrase
LFLQRRRLRVLTGARRCEISDLKCSEVRGEALGIPGDRTKTGKTFSITITPAIRTVLDGTPRHCGRHCPSGSSDPPPGLKLFNEAHASINVPSTVKCSVDNSFFTGG